MGRVCLLKMEDNANLCEVSGGVLVKVDAGAFQLKNEIFGQVVEDCRGKLVAVGILGGTRAEIFPVGCFDLGDRDFFFDEFEYSTVELVRRRNFEFGVCTGHFLVYFKKNVLSSDKFFHF